MSKFLLTPAAQTDLDDIWTSSHANWGIVQAEIYLLEIGRRIAALAAQPLLGRSCPEVRAGYFKYPSGSHTIFYQKTSGGITVIRILHSRMDPQRALPLD